MLDRLLRILEQGERGIAIIGHHNHLDAGKDTRWIGPANGSKNGIFMPGHLVLNRGTGEVHPEDVAMMTGAETVPASRIAEVESIGTSRSIREGTLTDRGASLGVDLGMCWHETRGTTTKIATGTDGMSMMAVGGVIRGLTGTMTGTSMLFERKETHGWIGIAIPVEGGETRG